MTDKSKPNIDGAKAARARLEQLLAALPVLPDRWNGIASEAERLYLVALLHRADDLPFAKRAGSRVAMQEIDRLYSLLLALTEHIVAMHREAFDAIESQLGDAPHPRKLVDDLFRVIEAVYRARDAGVVVAPAARDLHSKKQARRVTKEAALVFERLTGKAAKPATRLTAISAHQDGYRETGAFSEFLAGVFRILRIDASAASQVKLLSRKKSR